MLHLGALGPDGRAPGAVPDGLPVIGEDVAQPVAGKPALAGRHRAVGGHGHVAQARPAGGGHGQPQAQQRLGGQPAGAGEVDLHAVFGAVGCRLPQKGLQLLRGKAGGAAALGEGRPGGDEPRAGDVPHAQAVEERKRFGVAGVQAAQGGVHAHRKPRRQGVSDARHRVGKAGRAHKAVVNALVGAVEGDLHAVQAGLIEGFAKLGGEQPAVGVQPGDEPAGRVHQLHQIGAHGGLAAGEGDLRHTRPAQGVQHPLPAGGVQLLHLRLRLAGGVAVQALLVAVPAALLFHGADHQVHAVGGGHLGGVVPQTDGLHFLRRLLAPGDGDEALQHPLQLGAHALAANAGVDPPGGGHGLFAQAFQVFVGHLPAGVGGQRVHQAGQQDGPGKIQRQHVVAVQDDHIGHAAPQAAGGGQHVQPHHPRPAGVQGDVAHLREIFSAEQKLPQGHEVDHVFPSFLPPLPCRAALCFIVSHRPR